MKRFYFSKARTSVALLASIAVIAGTLGMPMAASAEDPELPTTIKPMKPVPGKSALPDEDPAKADSSKNVKTADFPTVEDVTQDLSLDTETVAHRVDAADPGVSDKVSIGEWERVGDTGITVAAVIEPESGDPTEIETDLNGDVTNGVVVEAAVEDAESGTGPFEITVTTDGNVDPVPLVVRIPGEYLAAQYGADFASRARWTETRAESSEAERAESTFDPETSDTTLFTNAESQSVTLSIAASPVSASGTGSFAASPLSAASSWDVSAQTGAFSWQYPLRTPPAAAGPQPSLALGYDSQSVDGETGSTNNQPSAVGEGWNVSGLGFIERTYVSCSQDDDDVPTSGDLCWKNNNAVLSFGGHSGKLVRDGVTSDWRLEKDDGTRIQRLTGADTGCVNDARDNECWKVTTTDGTQYFFGKNRLTGWATGNATTKSVWTVPVFGNDASEPCHESTFAASSCDQGWRWNLDYVVDVHANAQAIYYYPETNKYSRNGTTATTYTRGGQVNQVQYGFKDGNAYVANAAAATVLFGYNGQGRCVSTTGCSTENLASAAAAPATPSNYPDVPWDQLCTGSTCADQISPTFWTDGMLNTITTKVLSAGAYTTVDTWTLGHSFPNPGDGTSAALWLTKIDHQGTTSATTDPSTLFTGATMQNRVQAADGLAPLDKYRVTSIRTSMGAVISVGYSAQDCTPAQANSIKDDLENNHRRCFPQWWSPDVVPAQAAQKDLFHKYVVLTVSANPMTGGGRDEVQQTKYIYTGVPSWRYNSSDYVPFNRRTWSDFAGYDSVEVRVGTPALPAKQKVTQYTFYQGMDGDRASDSGGTKNVFVTGSLTLSDSLWFAGQVRNETTRNGVGGAIISSITTTPWASAVTAENNGDRARMVNDKFVEKEETLANLSTRTSTTTNTFDSLGFPVKVESATTDAGVTCTVTDYATPNDSKWIRGLPAQIAAVSTSCADEDSADYSQDALAESRIYYDGGTLSATPTLGNPTRVEVVDNYTSAAASSAHWIASAVNVYDAMGRVTKVTDSRGDATSTSYSPAAGTATAGLLQSMTSTNPAPFNWATTTTYDIKWGVPTSITDPNAKKTVANYDGLGRVLNVWAPDRPQATYPSSPTLGYAYTTSTTAANAVRTIRLGPSTSITDFELFDGLGRTVQTQSAAEGGGTVVTDTAYNSAGDAWATNNSYWTSSVSPSVVQFLPASQIQIPSETSTEFDGAGRTTASILKALGTERYRTTYAYPGADRVTTTPPSGGTPTTTVQDARGRTTSLIEYLGTTAGSSVPTKTTQYEYDGRGSMTSMTDPAGNDWTWTFDARGQLVSQSDPDSGTTTTNYDSAGRVLSTTDARGKTLAFAYDNLGRQTAKYENAVGITGKLLSTWIYDSIFKGLPTSSTSYAGSTAGVPGAAYKKAVTGYDAGYRPSGTSVTIPAAAPAFGGTAGTTYSKSIYYNQAGQPNYEILPAQGGLAAENLQTTYNAYGRVSGLIGAAAYANVVYTPIGQVSQYTRTGTSSLTQVRGYDQGTGALTNLQELALNASVYTTPSDLEYHYDDASNVTSIEASYGSATETQCFDYDYLENLTEAWTPSSLNCAQAPSSTALGGPAPYWKSWAIDTDTGNRFSSTVHATTAAPNQATESYTYPVAGSAQVHAVQSVAKTVAGVVTTKNYAYDASGNTTSRPGQTLDYDASGNLTKITYTGGTEEKLIYDADGELLMRSGVADGTTLYLDRTELKIASGATVASATRTYSIDGVPIAERTTAVGVTGSVVNWLSPNAQNTVALEVNAATGVQKRRYSDPYGVARGTAVTWSSAHGYLNAPAFNASGLTHLGARDYDPTIGRFTSVDPILEPLNPQQNNGYSYSANSPVTLTDPLGTRPLGRDDNANVTPSSGGGGKPPTAPKTGGKSGTSLGSTYTLPPPGGFLGTPTYEVPPIGPAIAAWLSSVAASAKATLAAAASASATVLISSTASIVLVLSLSGDSTNARAAGDAAAAADPTAAAVPPPPPNQCWDGLTCGPPKSSNPTKTADEVKSSYDSLPRGRNPDYRQLDEPALREWFETMTKNAVDSPLTNYGSNYGGGISRLLQDGTRISLREGSHSGGATVDFQIPGMNLLKIHTPK